uniref:Mutator family transposase n=1 Tax=uncultured bacterium contig00088 TaxID=1181561 RepID=A0A806KKU9_9BACT|nr:mobile element protein [uncultured bacterium contig00088]
MVTTRRKKKEKDVLDQILDTVDFRGLTRDEVVGKDGLIKQLSGRILQRALEAEMTGHLGYEKHSNAGDNSGNSRNGHTRKTVLLENGSTTVDVPRDRNGTFEPVILPSTAGGRRCSTSRSSRLFSFG